MWCSVCQSDVATEVGADNQRVNCSNCGHLLGGATGASPDPTTAKMPASGPDTRAEEARQLLDRWAKGHFFDPYGPPKKGGSDSHAGVPSPLSGSQTRAENEASNRVTDRSSAVSPILATSIEDSRNRETVDERSFLADYQTTDSNEGISSNPAKSQSINVPDSSSPPTQIADLQSASQNGDAENPAGISDPASAAASAAELDRLTREIMARVSKITESREAAKNEDALNNGHADQPSSFDSDQTDTAFSQQSPEPEAVTHQVTETSNGSSSSISDIDESDIPARNTATSSLRTDVAHWPTELPEETGASSSTQPVPASGGWYTNIGQMLAYLGIIFLTAGTCGVIVSYFGGPTSYAPYGWLGATIGQMLLFLGIVTLISAGMEQTTQELRQTVDQRMDEVAQRLDQIGSRIMRIEEASSEGPRKPHLLSKPEQERRPTERSAAGRIGRDA